MVCHLHSVCLGLDILDSVMDATSFGNRAMAETWLNMAWYVCSWFLVPASDLSEFSPVLQGLRINVEGADSIIRVPPIAYAQSKST